MTNKQLREFSKKIQDEIFVASCDVDNMERTLDSSDLELMALAQSNHKLCRNMRLFVEVMTNFMILHCVEDVYSGDPGDENETEMVWGM